VWLNHRRRALKVPLQRLRYVSLVIVIGVITVIAALYFMGFFDNSSNPNNGDSVCLNCIIYIGQQNVIYQTGEDVDIEISVEGDTEPGKIEINVFDPLEQLWNSLDLDVTIGKDLTALASGILGIVGNDDISGVYEMRANYMGTNNSATFIISSSVQYDLEISDLHFESIFGSEVSEVNVNDTIMITGDITNNGEEEIQFSFIAEIRDNNSSLIHSGYVGTAIDQGKATTLSMGWPTSKEGEFKVYVYIKKEFRDKLIISSIESLSFRVK
jgi:hypothetical protein